jgi:hypothetical protein
MATIQDWQTRRRLQALALHNKGWKQKTIAEALGVTKGAVSQWLKRARGLAPTEQAQVLQVKKSTGRPPRLTDQQKLQMASLAESDAEEYGFTGSFWTLKRIQFIANRDLEIQVSLGSIRNILIAYGISHPKPRKAPVERQSQKMHSVRNDKSITRKPLGPTEKA